MLTASHKGPAMDRSNGRANECKSIRAIALKPRSMTFNASLYRLASPACSRYPNITNVRIMRKAVPVSSPAREATSERFNSDSLLPKASKTRNPFERDRTVLFRSFAPTEAGGGTPLPFLLGFLGVSDADDLLTSAPYDVRGNPVNARLLHNLERYLGMSFCT